ncbi:HAD family hydrolase [Nocardiopsis flavescens]|uniref:Putative hydrolase of the HAD superfamily n=1 Tax=Nocardiopsis flavescens TaxID=758803 RepID=A0A1M6BHB9_9ACTN|nr:HAD family phosphatase [Nocardiopsis flavescens]SHI48170.1 putative hydrolase of the HAD superfamily [Nocardiopsis flavescens]
MPETASGAVLFDLFGVIARHQSEEGKRLLTETMGAADPAAFWEAYWDLRLSYDRGDLDGLAYWRAVGERLGREVDPALAAALISADIDSWRAVDPAMVSLVERLASGGRTVGLLSNIPADLADRFEKENPWLAAFSVRAFSGRLGVAKPEPEVYLWCLERMAVSPGETLFVDDRSENVAAAEALGMSGHLFTDRTALEARL